MGKDLFNPHLRKFSIRKLSIGVCSVLLSTLLLLGATSQVNTPVITIECRRYRLNSCQTRLGRLNMIVLPTS